MTQRAGISMDDELWERVEAERRLPDGTIQSRSETVCELLRLGLMARETMREAPWDHDRGSHERRYTQQALRNLNREESD
jgi:metal-responsive CopG/Arc/MetJ family transcriptional regulator